MPSFPVHHTRFLAGAVAAAVLVGGGGIYVQSAKAEVPEVPVQTAVGDGVSKDSFVVRLEEPRDGRKRAGTAATGSTIVTRGTGAAGQRASAGVGSLRGAAAVAEAPPVRPARASRAGGRVPVADGLTVEALEAAAEAVGPGGELARDSQGRLIYRLGDRSVVVGEPGTVLVAPAEQPPAPRAEAPADPPAADEPVADGEPTDDDTSEDESAASVVVDADHAQDLIDAIEDQDGVVSAQELHDGTVLVVAPDLSLDEVEDLPGVESAERSVVAYLQYSTPNDPAWSYAWQLDNVGYAYNQAAVAGADIDAYDAWDATLGEGVVVAVIDTGYLPTHPDMVGALWENPKEVCGAADVDRNGKVGDCHGWNFFQNNADIANGGTGQDVSHGTAVAGHVAARVDNGIGSAGAAPGATIMPLVVGTKQGLDLNLAAEALRYAVDHGATIVTCSFGGYGVTDLFRKAVDYARSKGVTVVAAAGNDSLNRETTPMYPASLPMDNIISVGATGANDQAAEFSAYGATHVDLFAPGKLLHTPWNTGGYMLASGTSFSAPLVSGALALYKSLHPAATPAQMKKALLDGVTKLPALAGRSVTGGRLDVSFVNDGTAGPVRYAFSGFGDRPSGPLAGTVSISGAAEADAVRLTLGVKQSATVLAVADAEVTVDGATYVTGDDGSVSVPLGFTGRVSLATGLDLPDGDYALLAQLTKAGQPVTRPSAAPFVVGALRTPAPDASPSASATRAPQTPAPGAPAPGDPAPGAPAPGAPAPGTTPAPTAPAPGTSSAPGAPGAPGAPAPGSSAPAPGTSSAPAPGPSTGASSAPGAPAPGAPAPGPSSVPGAPAPGPGAPGPGAPDPGAPDPGAPDPGTGGAALSIQAVSPASLTLTEAGRLVTVSGSGFGPDSTLMLGSSPVRDVVSVKPSEIIFRAPALVAGTFDLTVTTSTGRVVARGAVRYVDPSASSPAPTFSAPGGPSRPGPGSTSTPAPTAPTAPAPTAPGAPAPGAPGPSAPATSAPAPAPSRAPTVVPSAPTTTAPAPGTSQTPVRPRRPIRLVPNAELAAIDASSLWGLTGCESTCVGLQV